jgi:hypothetical protein
MALLRAQHLEFAGVSGFRTEGGCVFDEVVDVVLQFGPAHFFLFYLLVYGEIYLLLNPIDFVVEPVVLVIEVAEVRVAALESLDRVAMFRELAKYGMVQVHWMFSWLTGLMPVSS